MSLSLSVARYKISMHKRLQVFTVQVMATRKYPKDLAEAIKRTRTSHSAMVSRCTRPSSGNYSRYGGKNITVCDQWLSFSSFLKDMGPRPKNTSLDRIDNTRGYEPGNCRWATQQQQLENRRKSPEQIGTLIEFQGVTLSMQQWSLRLGLHRSVVARRISYGWPIERALSNSCAKKQSTTPWLYVCDDYGNQLLVFQR